TISKRDWSSDVCSSDLVHLVVGLLCSETFVLHFDLAFLMQRFLNLPGRFHNLQLFAAFVFQQSSSSPPCFTISYPIISMKNKRLLQNLQLYPTVYMHIPSK